MEIDKLQKDINNLKNTMFKMGENIGLIYDEELDKFRFPSDVDLNEEI